MTRKQMMEEILHEMLQGVNYLKTGNSGAKKGVGGNNNWGEGGGGDGPIILRMACWSRGRVGGIKDSNNSANNNNTSMLSRSTFHNSCHHKKQRFVSNNG